MKLKNTIFIFSFTVMFFACSQEKMPDIISPCFLEKFESDNAIIEKSSFTPLDSHQETSYKIKISELSKIKKINHFHYSATVYNSNKEAKSQFNEIPKRELKAPGCFIIHKNIIYALETACSFEEGMGFIIEMFIDCFPSNELKDKNIIRVACGGRMIM